MPTAVQVTSALFTRVAGTRFSCGTENVERAVALRNGTRITVVQKGRTDIFKTVSVLIKQKRKELTFLPECMKLEALKCVIVTDISGK